MFDSLVLARNIFMFHPFIDGNGRIFGALFVYTLFKKHNINMNIGHSLLASPTVPAYGWHKYKCINIVIYINYIADVWFPADRVLPWLSMPIVSSHSVDSSQNRTIHILCAILG